MARGDQKLKHGDIIRFTSTKELAIIGIGVNNKDRPLLNYMTQNYTHTPRTNPEQWATYIVLGNIIKPLTERLTREK